MKTVVMSVGGSLIIPESIDFQFLHKLKKELRKHYKTRKFVIVCGGGAIARKYISALKEENKSNKELSLAGIRATRMNAMFLMQFFGEEANSNLPRDMQEVEHNLKNNHVVICGALRFSPDSTSDTTAAKLAHNLNSPFINMTNVKGLFDSDPKNNPKAKFISRENWKDFEKRANAIKHSPGQHFVLDQQAAKIIREYKIPTYIIGKDVKNLGKLLAKKKFLGTTIEG